MKEIVATSIAILAVLGFVGWLGGGRKWAFRTMLSAMILTGAGIAGVLLNNHWTEKSSERQAQKLHDCAVAKVAKAQCIPKTDPYAEFGGKMLGPKDGVGEICPPYTLPDDPTSEQEYAAVAAAEEECAGEMNFKQKPLNEQISQYRREHGIVVKTGGGTSSDKWAKYEEKGDVFDRGDAKKKRLSDKACAAKVRKAYPGAYDDFDDASLTRKVLAKYPGYCDLTPPTPGFEPVIEGIR